MSAYCGIPLSDWDRIPLWMLSDAIAARVDMLSPDDSGDDVHIATQEDFARF